MDAYFTRMPENAKVKSKYGLVCKGGQEQILGMHIIGPSSSEIVQGFGLAAEMGETKKDLDDFCPVHLTSAQELTTIS